MEKLKCDGCGANSFVKKGNKMICEYCGTEYVIDNDNNLLNQGFKSLKNAFDKTINNPLKESFKSFHNDSEKSTDVGSNSYDKSEAIVDFIVTICLGAMGIHKFMKGKIGLGILYLLTGGIFGIGYIIDIIFSGAKLLGVSINKK